MHRQDLKTLEEALGHRFSDPGLLLLALTHPSAVAGEGADNQRLEFLGDAVLQLCISDMLYRSHPDTQEGGLTRMRAALVREASLAAVARGLSLGRYLRLDHGENATGGRDKPSVLSDAMEAVLAAVYLDGGLNTARAVCAHVFEGFTAEAVEPSWKSLLQEREQAQGRHTPDYRVTGEDGPPHARVFTVEATLEDGRHATGQGASKKQAEQRAAQALMEA